MEYIVKNNTLIFNQNFEESLDSYCDLLSNYNKVVFSDYDYNNDNVDDIVYLTSDNFIKLLE